MSWVTILFIILIAQGVILSVFVLLENRHPMATLAWVLVLCLLPLVGALLYYFFGRRRFHKRRRFRAKALEPLLKAHRYRNPSRELSPTEREVKAEPEPVAWTPEAIAETAQRAATEAHQAASTALHTTAAQEAVAQDDEALRPRRRLFGRQEPKGPKEAAPPPAPQYRPTTVPAVQRDSIPVIDLASRIIPAPLTDDNHVAILRNADATYDAIERAIRGATHHVHVMFYIIREDETGAWLRDLLVEQAQRGVEVRLLYDAIGCYGTTPMFFQPLRDAGGQVAEFMPVRLSWPIKQSYVNFRNHRKLVVVDGRIGFTGGINIGDEYRGKDPNIGHWRDDHLQIDGPANHYLQHVFAEDWCHVTDELLAAPAYFPFEKLEPADEEDAQAQAIDAEESASSQTIDADESAAAQAADAAKAPDEPDASEQQALIQTYMGSLDHKAMLQIVPSGPDQPWYSIRLLFFAAIASARDRVWMTTPYFVPDGAILTAITATALRGVDVRLLLPARGDNPLVRFAGRSYYRRLLQAGVRIYEYQDGMLHAKTMVVDHHYGTIGSANLDMRSFHINFEINAFVYEEEFAQQLEAQFLEDLESSQEIERIAFSKRPIQDRLLEASARIFSPLL